MDKYEIDNFENLSDEELDEIMKYIPAMSPELQNNIMEKIKNEENKPDMKNNKKTVVAIAVLVAAISLVSFTQLDRIKDGYNKIFGGDMSGYSESINKTTEENGIEMELVEAVSVGDGTYLIIDLKDLEGDRLGGDLTVDQQDWRIENGGNLSGGNCHFSSYNESTNTATLIVQAIGGKPGKEAKFILEGVTAKDTYIDGCWEIDFITPKKVNDVKIDNPDNLKVGEYSLPIEKMSVSPANINIIISKNDIAKFVDENSKIFIDGDLAMIGELDIEYVYKDGSTYKNEGKIDFGVNNRDEELDYSIVRIVPNFEDLVSFKINGVEYKIN